MLYFTSLKLLKNPDTSPSNSLTHNTAISVLTNVASNVKAPDYHVLARTIWCLSSECSLPLEGASQDGSITSTGSPSLGSRTTPAESSTRDTRHNITTTSVQVTTDSASITPSATSSSSGFTTAINPSSPSQPFTARTSRTTSWSPDLRPTESILSSSSPIHSISATPISSSPIHIPAIVGGVVGVAVLMTIFVTWLLCCRRRRRQATDGKGRAGIHPFTVSARRTSLIRSSELPSPCKESFLLTAEPTSSVGAVVGSSSTIVDEINADARTGLARESLSRFTTPPYLRTTKDTPSEPAPTPDGRTCAPTNPRNFPDTSNPPLALPTDIAQALAHESRVLSPMTLALVRSLLQRDRVQDLRLHRAEVDSGLRIYDDIDAPPPEYTAG